MADGIYIALSGARAFEQRLETVSNNLANIGTSGFKQDRVRFEEFIENLPNAGSSPREESHYTLASSGLLDLKPGPLTETGSDYDIAVEGDGFFRVADQNGTPRYWRGGNLAVRADGILSTTAGVPVLDEGGGQISLGAFQPIQILEDGRIVAGKGEDTQPVAKLAFVKLDKADEQLIKVGGAFYGPRDPGAPPVESPAEGRVQQGFIEQSNVDPTRAMVDVISAARNFEQMVRYITDYKKLDQRLVMELSQPR